MRVGMNQCIVGRTVTITTTTVTTLVVAATTVTSIAATAATSPISYDTGSEQGRVKMVW